jgi:CubicO group peptidase (beta-lactamase class C family)
VIDVLDLAEAHSTTALIVRQGDTTVVEQYWPPRGDVLGLQLLPDGRTREDVASAQKSVTSMLVGIGVTHGLVDLDAPVSRYVGDGWTHAGVDAESAITVRHLLTMTSGLDDRLHVVAAPGMRWDYNLGGAYHTLKRVIAAAAGADIATTSREWLFDPLGMVETEWIARPLPPQVNEAMRPFVSYPDGMAFEGLVTSARDLVSFGAAILEVCRGGDGPLAPYAAYVQRALTPSTELNPAYGLLWWLNGQPWRLAPRIPDRIDGPLIPDAPNDLVAMLGAHGRAVYVVPSAELVVVRMGGDPGDGVAAGGRFGEELWKHLCVAL